MSARALFEALMPVGLVAGTLLLCHLGHIMTSTSSSSTEV